MLFNVVQLIVALLKWLFETLSLMALSLVDITSFFAHLTQQRRENVASITHNTVLSFPKPEARILASASPFTISCFVCNLSWLCRFLGKTALLAITE